MLTRETMDRTTLILTLMNVGMNVGLAAKIDAKAIEQGCARVGKKQIPANWYKYDAELQSELLTNPRFAEYLFAFMADTEKKAEELRKNEDKSSGYLYGRRNYYSTDKQSERLIREQIQKIMKLVSGLRKCGGVITDYPVEQIDILLGITDLPDNVGYCYLENFSRMELDETRRMQILMSLRYYKESIQSEMTAEEKALFLDPGFLQSELIPRRFQQVCVLFEKDAHLKELIRFLYDNDISVSMSIGDYLAIQQTNGTAYDMLPEIFEMFGKDSEIMSCFIQQWADNGCVPLELETLEQRLKNVPPEEWEDLFSTKSAYINLLYGTKVKNLQLSELSSYQEDIMIHAITRNKKAFIRLVEENRDAFTRLGSNSILFYKELYENHLNLNELTARDLSDCFWMRFDKLHADELDDGRIYTFSEIRALYDAAKPYVCLYNLLTDRTDKRLVILKQLRRRKALDGLELEQDDMLKLALRLNEKPIYDWLQNDFAHISSLQLGDAVQLLIRYDKIARFIPQMKNRAEVMLAVRNVDALQIYNSFNDVKAEIHRIDETWHRLAETIGLSAEFMKRYQDNIIEFLCRDGAQLAQIYIGCLADEQREGMKRIVKSILMGEFYTLKYFADDLKRELDYPVESTVKNLWSKNTEYENEEIVVRECDDYFSTMQLGVMPQRTCLSYIDGQYRQCLLSGFDSNKKVLNAFVDGKIAARAIVRLTKGRFNGNTSEGTSLAFMDPEKITETGVAVNNGKSLERLTIFLEKPYMTGLSPVLQKKAKELFIKLLEQKAAELGAMLVLSDSYAGLSEEYTRTMYYLYISKSKAGAQYLDSLGGEARVEKEGSYSSNSFLIRQADI